MELDAQLSEVMHPPAMTLTLLTPKSNQKSMNLNTSCDQNWVKFPSLGCEIHTYTKCIYKVQKNKRVTMRRSLRYRQVQASTFSVLWWYGVHKAFGSLPAVTLTFDFFIPKFNQKSMNPNASW